ncbi:MAG: CehA/McbA family metallohydrolase [Deltaproteobacteria bacterium]|nr:CehA/McbA family metallohydrolase [Deltaproteobacteria bacterium]
MALRRVAFVMAMGVIAAAAAACGDGGAGGAAPGDAPDADAPDADAPDADGPDAPAGDTGEDAGTDADTPEPARGAIFREGCPVPGRALARRIGDPDARPEGPNAIGRDGDFIIASEHAAFVIEDAAHRNAYYLYGGIPIDAVAVDGCRQAGPDRFQEIGLMVGVLDASDLASSVLRAFRADRVEVVADGSDGGPAVVRATGTDDFFWLVEGEMTKWAFRDGKARPRSAPLGIDVIVDYVLDPGSGVLRIEIAYRNRDADPKGLLAGATALFGGETRQFWYADTQVDVGGFGFEVGVPWLAASAGDGAWAFAMEATSWGTANFSGMTALVDVRQAVADPLALAPAGEPGAERKVTYFLAVGATDANSATRRLLPVNPEPVPGLAYSLWPISGEVREGTGPNAAPVAGATVLVEARNGADRWMPLDALRTGPDGRFAGEIADFGPGGPALRLRVQAAGRNDAPPVDLAPGDPGPHALAVGPAGRLRVDVRDGDGAPLPAKVLLWQGGAVRERLYAGATPGEHAVRPGEYEVSVTRGFEHEAWHGSVTVPAGGAADLAATLPRVVDTSGWMSADTHLHAAPSPDNRISVEDRISTIAAEGLEVAVSTDHEAVSDWSFGVTARGLGAFVATVVGEEVTATLPEHCTMAAVEPRPDVDARGGIVRWYGLDLAQLFGAMRSRGAGLVGLNHPLGYMKDIGYDPLTGAATLDDPGRLGFPAGAALWSWDFDMFELMNGTRAIFRAPGSQSLALFDAWMSFHNLGHRVTAVGASDAHDWDSPGTPRTYFASPTDDPAAFDEAAFVEAMRKGRAVASAGAFARVSVNGVAGPGDTVTDTDGQVDLSIVVSAMPAVDVARVVVFVNCDEALLVPASAAHVAVKLDTTVTVPLAGDAHVVVAGIGDDPMPAGLDPIKPGIAGAPRFVTNPIFVDADGNGAFDPPGGKPCAYTLGGGTK